MQHQPDNAAVTAEALLKITNPIYQYSQLTFNSLSRAECFSVKNEHNFGAPFQKTASTPTNKAGKSSE